MNATASPDPISFAGTPQSAPPGVMIISGTSGVITGGRTGGAPGSETYAWSIVGPTTAAPGASVIGAGLVDPANGATNRVALAGSDVAAPFAVVPMSTVARLTVTDPHGNVSTEDVTVTMT